MISRVGGWRGRRERIWGARHSLIALLGGMAFVVLSSADVAATKPMPARLSLSRGGIVARFYPAPPGAHPCPRGDCQTVYTMFFNHAVLPVTVTWRLQLRLVDPAGAADPSTPGSGAAVDLGCNNDGNGTNKPHRTVFRQSMFRDAFFAWYHPDGADSNPAGKYNCDHLDQGPHGHQGLITVTVRDRRGQICTVSYKGTHAGDSQSQGEKTHCKL